MKKKICLITGATSGIGRATALELGRLGANLILVGRNTEKGQKILSYIRKKFRNDNVEFFKTDLSIKREIHKLSSSINEKYDHIDILINNAGARFKAYQQNNDEIELTFAINYLSHFLLTLLLLKKFKRSSGARIINVSSSAHSSSTGDLVQMFNAKEYNRKIAYANSKLANLLFTYELARRFKNTNITVNAMHPGGVATMIGVNDGFFIWSKHIIYYLFQGKLLSPRKGAETILYLATSSDVQNVSGKYFFQKKEVRSSDISYNRETAINLWNLSLRLTQLKDQRPNFDVFAL